MPGSPMVEERQRLLAQIAEAKQAGSTYLHIQFFQEEHLVAPEILPKVWELTHLTSLSLLLRGLAELPAGIGGLTNLEKLKIQGEALRALPAELGGLTRLVELELEDVTALEALPPEIGRLASLRELSVTAGGNGLRRLPDEIGALAALEKLEIERTRLEALPESIGGWGRLTKLSLARNQLRALPAAIGRLERLEELEAKENQLAELPDVFEGLRKLRVLDLRKNAFARLPEPALRAPALRVLRLGANQISEIPEAVASAPSLRYLGLWKNQISVLPASLLRSPLEQIDLEDNRIRNVPPELAATPGVAEVILVGNPLQGVPPEIVAQGKRAIAEHLGFAKPASLSGDVPADEKERAAIIRRYEDSIDRFVREGSFDDDTGRSQTVADFLLGKSDRIPGALFGDVLRWEKELREVLAPYAQWTFVDRRLLRIFTQRPWAFFADTEYEQGYHDTFLVWLGEQLETSADPELFGKVAEELAACGISEAELARLSFHALYEKMIGADGAPTSFGRWLLARLDALLPALVETVRDRAHMRSRLVKLLVENAPAAFAKVASELVRIEPDEKGEVHLPIGELEVVCPSDPARWEPLVLEGISRAECPSCKAHGARILIDGYGEKHRERAFALVCEALVGLSARKNEDPDFSWGWDGSGYSLRDEATPAFVAWILGQFGARVRDPLFRYVDGTRLYSRDIAESAARALGQDAVDVVAEGLGMAITGEESGSHFQKIFGLLAPLDWSAHEERAWKLARNEVVSVREAACAALARLGPGRVLDRAKALLAAAKPHERDAGILVLSQLDAPEAKALLVPLLDSEKNDDVRDRIVARMYRDEAPIDRAEVARRVASAAARKKLGTKLDRWFEGLPPLSWKGGGTVDADTLRFLFYRQGRLADVGPEAEARAIYPLLDRRSSAEFASALLQSALGAGGLAAKNRPAMSLVGLLGGDDVIPPVEEIAKEKANENACAVLGLLGTMEAARALDRIQKTFRVKYPNVRQAAEEAFAGIGDRLGKSPYELADAMIPDLGFRNGRRPFAIGEDSLDLILTSDCKIALRAASGKVLKDLPKGAPKPLRAELTALRAEVREAAKQLGRNLELSLVVQRRWGGAEWKAFFGANAIAAALAESLIWGTYRDGRLEAAFQVEGGETVDADVEPLALADDARVGLVHPLELEPAALRAWADARVDRPRPPFAQLERPVIRVAPEDAEKTMSAAFAKATVDGDTFKSRASRQGWRRGSIGDAGSISSYRKTWPAQGLDSFVELEGLGVGFGGGVARIKDLWFVKTGAVVAGSYTFDEPRGPGDARLVKLGAVAPLVYSEAMADLRAMTGKNEDAEAEEG